MWRVLLGLGAGFTAVWGQDPPPSPPFPPLGTLSVATPLQAALSTTFSSGFAADNCIDGQMSSVCATTEQSGGTLNWASVRVAAGAHVGVVAVYNRRDYTSIEDWLHEFDVWVGPSAGAASTGAGATRCGGMGYDQRQPQTYLLDCAEAGRALIGKNPGRPHLAAFWLFTSFTPDVIPSPHATDTPLRRFSFHHPDFDPRLLLQAVAPASG